ncbi:hypothetical protein ISS37_07530 [candidate division KSB1 bacterium]|nr:hypothetical protein [candidate division KSB1 bacterium]
MDFEVEEGSKRELIQETQGFSRISSMVFLYVLFKLSFPGGEEEGKENIITAENKKDERP